MTVTQAPADSNRTVTADRDDVLESARRARRAARALAGRPRADKDAALVAMATSIRSGEDRILAANAEDVAAGRASGMSEARLDRLTLTPRRIEAMAAGLDTLVALPDPVGEVVRGSVLPNGLRLTQVRVPLGVVAIIYEARPNVTVDAAGIALKSGNAALLRGSASGPVVEFRAGRPASSGLGLGRLPGRRGAAGPRDGPGVGEVPDDSPRPGRRDHPARWRRADRGRRRTGRPSR